MAQTIGGAPYTYDLSPMVTDIDTNYQNVDGTTNNNSDITH